MYGKTILFCKVVSLNSIRYYNKGSSKKLLEFLAKMPKENAAKSAKKTLRKVSQKIEKIGPSTVYLQALGSGARGAPNALYLFTDQKRYLFNCGEGTQRLAHEHKVKLSRLNDIFITNKSWQNIGGLPGLSLTLQDVGVPQLVLHGPEGLDELYDATERFVTMKDMNITTVACNPNNDFDDNVMTVKYVLLGPKGKILKTESERKAKKPKLEELPLYKKFEEFIDDDTDYYLSFQPPGRKQPLLRLKSGDPIKAKKKTLDDFQEPSDSTVAFICMIKKRLGTLNLEKCVEMGIKPGPVLGQLKSGQDVVLPDGRIVRSQDVKTPDDPGPVFIVLEVPDISYLKESEFSAHFDDGKNPPENIPTVIVHYTPTDVLNHPTYRTFMSKFGPSTEHLVLNTLNSCMGSEAVHRTQHRLHLLDEEMFPLLRDTSVRAVWTDTPGGGRALDELKNKIAVAQFQNIMNAEGAGEGGADGDVITARTLTIYHLRPRRGVDRSVELKLHIQEYIKEAMDADGFVESADTFREVVQKMRSNNNQKKYPKVVFLGTGSCIPSKTRNTSSIMLQISETNAMLLDCGEGTFGQLVRFYGPKRIDAYLRALKAIYISHLHADHHIGLIGLLQARREALKDVPGPATPIYLLAPGQIVSWLAMYHQQFENICDEFTLIPNQSLLPEKISETTDMTPAILASIGVQSIRTCIVAHCPNAFGVAIDVDQHRITYSGDALPTQELVKLGQDSTLLIHEATMEDELEDEARFKMHSTTSQAIDIGRQMNAKHVILTHFSQRYARLPRISTDIFNVNNSVGIAFDNMQVTMSDLDLLPHIYRPLQLMFADHCVELEMKAAQRAKQKEKLTQVEFPSSDTSSPDSIDKKDFSNETDDIENGENVINKKYTVKKRSPSCNSRASAQYRDSNASRLRHEKSRSSSIEAKTYCRSSSCSSKNSAKVKASKRSPSIGSESRSPERVSIASPRMNAASYFRKNAIEKIKPTEIIPIIDTRSKTTNKVVPTLKQTNNVCTLRCKTATIKKKCTPSVFALEKKSPCTKKILSTESRGHDTSTKMSVTTQNNIHTYRQEINSRIYSAGSKKSSIPRIRTKSPSPEQMSQKTVPPYIIKPNESVIEKYRQRTFKVQFIDIFISILYHLLLWKLHYVISCLSHLQWQLLVTVIAIGYLFWTAVNNVAGLRRDRTGGASFNGLSYAESPIKTIPFKKPANYSSKSFKPQLEDIKSSYLLLNKNNLASDNNKIKEKKEFERTLIRNLQSISEKQRKERLEEIRKKFKTKKFWNDSKYNRIEGLNWISWK